MFRGQWKWYDDQLGVDETQNSVTSSSVNFDVTAFTTESKSISIPADMMKDLTCLMNSIKHG